MTESKTRTGPSKSAGQYQPMAWSRLIMGSIIATGVLMGLLSFNSLHYGDRMNASHAPWVAAAMQTKLEVTTAHLWFEEILSGDRHESIDTVWQHLSQADRYALAMLNGRDDPGFTVLPLQRPLLRQNIQTLRQILGEFMQITVERHASWEGMGAGSEIDQRYDAVFADIMNKADIVITELQDKIRLESIQFRAGQHVLIALVLGTTLLVALLFRTYERQWRYHVRALEQARTRLSANEKELNSIIRDLPALICRNRPDGTIEFVNDAYCEYFGKTREELVGHDFFGFIPDTDREAVRAALLELGTEHPRLQHEHQVIAADGSNRYQRWTNQAICDEKGQVVLLQAYGEDITEQKQSERLATENHLRLATLMSNLPGMAFRCAADQNWTLSFLSEGCKALTGYDVIEFHGDNRVVYNQLIHPDDQQRVRDEIEAGLAKGAAYELEYRLIKKNGEVRWVWERGSAVYSPISELDALDGIVLDNHARKLAEVKAIESQRETQSALAVANQARQTLISVLEDQREAELALRRESERAQLILSTTMDGYVLSDTSPGRVLDVNPAYCALIGYSREELLTMTLDQLDSQLNQEQIDAKIADCLLVGNARFQTRHRHRDGRDIDLDINVSVLTPQGVPLMVSFVRDITEQQSAERERNKLLKSLQTINQELDQRVQERTADLLAANKELESFTYSVSHDLRAPLRAITGFSEILAKRHVENLNDEGRHYLNNVLEAGARMGTLIEDLLRYSRTGRGAVHCRPVELAPLLDNLASTFGTRLAETHARLEIQKPLATPWGDITLVHQILTNLIDNAVTYHDPARAPEIKVSALRRENRVVIKVADNGIGIAPEFHEKVFQAFQRLHTDEDYPGTGVGLAIITKAVHLMKGTITMESTPGVGTQFCVSLPATEDTQLTEGSSANE